MHDDVDGVFTYPTLAECYETAGFNGINRLGAWLRAAYQSFTGSQPQA